jgi:hypothetical protein
MLPDACDEGQHRRQLEVAEQATEGVTETAAHHHHRLDALGIAPDELEGDAAPVAPRCQHDLINLEVLEGRYRVFGMGSGVEPVGGGRTRAQEAPVVPRDDVSLAFDVGQHPSPGRKVGPYRVAYEQWESITLTRTSRG